MSDAVWTTQDGRKIPIRWMESRHLVHSFNLLARRNNFGKSDVKLTMQRDKSGVVRAMVDELRARMLYNWRPDQQLDTSKLPARETPKQLCMLRALIDCGYGVEMLQLFREHPDASIEHWTSTADPKWDRVKVKFVEYRMFHEGA